MCRVNLQCAAANLTNKPELTPVKIPTTLLAALFIVSAAFTSATVAVAQGLQQKLLGVWEVDEQPTRELGAESAKAMDQYNSLRIAMAIEFKADELPMPTDDSEMPEETWYEFSVQLSVGGGSLSHEGAWTIAREGKRTMTIEMKAADQNTPRKMLIEFLEDNQLMIGPERKSADESPAFVLKRKS